MSMHVDRYITQWISSKHLPRGSKKSICETKTKPRAFADSHVFIIDLTTRKISKPNFSFPVFCTWEKTPPKSNSSVLQDTLVHQAYCIATDLQILVNFSASKTKKSVKNIKHDQKKMWSEQKYSGKFYYTLVFAHLFAIFDVHYKLQFHLHILWKA